MNRRKIMYVFSTITILLILLQSGSIIHANTEQVSSEVSIEPREVEIQQPFVDSMRKYLIHFSNPEALENFVSQHDVKRVYPYLKMVIVEDMLSEKDNLKSIDGVKNVFDLTDTKYTQIKQPEDPVYLVSNAEKIKLTKQTADILNVSFLWDLGYKGSSIIAYDIDSGINTQHVDFQGRIMEESKSFITKENGYDINDPSIEDENGHGTHTAGIMAGAGVGNAEYIGMAPEAKILVGRLGSPAPPEAFIAAFEYALELKENGTIVNVINLSWGGTDTEGQDAEEAMIRELYLNNILVAVAAGNSGTNYYTVESPGAEAQSISVAATKQTGQGQAYFSSVGPTADGYVKPDLAAPGMGIMSCGIASSTDYVSMQGTSMSTPAITGAAAVLIDVLKGLSIPYDAGMIKTAMMLSADDQGLDYLKFGAGVPDLGKALDLIKAAPKNDSGFPVLLWAIPELDVPFYQEINQGFYASIYVKSVSSTPWEDKTPVLSGTITQIATLNTTPATDPWDKNYELIFDVPLDAAVGDYEGKITFETAKGVTAETIIKVKVVPGEKRILLAKMHTNWGMDHLLGQYIYFIEDLNSKGIAVNEIET
ncbi:MAG: S8 family serine peptidase [Candidatus Heimdallarchaeum aukensis]|uniref:S8 family serine peptidase n=1 Tax=Candidatus Heimdallarchaeum aukensis TaxID=2876573 RepID=A0A9Y1FMS2_9ARCH|nr:MAG: S8 family serine peptidase [Candidatus Heimdallarchaeum aukensis]